MTGRTAILEKLLSSEIKADILTLFHKEPNLITSIEDISERIGRQVSEVHVDVNDLVLLGLLKERRIVSFDSAKDAEIQADLSRELLSLAERGDFDTSHQTSLRTGVPVLDEAVPEGYPYPSVTLILGDPATGKTTLINQYVAEALKQGYSVVYATLDDFPDTVRKSLRSFGVEVPDAESREKLWFIDCYSHLVGYPNKEKYSEDPRMLSDLSIVISKALTSQNRAGKIVLAIDSLTTILEKGGVRPTLDFIHILVAKTRAHIASCLLSMARKAFHPAIVAALQDRVDGVIEMKTEEISNGIERMMRILKMRGGKHSTSWFAYTKDPKRGLVKL